MGVFSWVTADTKKSVRLNDKKPVYLLQPGGRAPIEETNYDGYGMFGGVDAHEWLFNENAELFGITPVDLEGLSQRRAEYQYVEDTEPLTDKEEAMLEQFRERGISLDIGDAFRDTTTGEMWSVLTDDRVLVGGKFFPDRFDVEIPEFGACMNDLVKSGRFETVRIRDLVDHKPLKFSHNKAAVYEELPASTQCPRQGC